MFDVRTPEEAAAHPVDGVPNAPGGQLLQTTDHSIAVRGSRVLLLDDDGVRAPVVAGWMRRQGFDAATVDGGLAADLAIPPRRVVLPATPLERLTLAQFLARQRHMATLDLQPSMQYRRAHVPGAQWAIRPQLGRVLAARPRAVTLVSPDETAERLAAVDLAEGGVADIAWIDAAQVIAAGLASAVTPQHPADAEAIDYLFFLHDRHAGNLDAARRYIAWETGLIAQCDASELAAARAASPGRGPALAASPA